MKGIVVSIFASVSLFAMVDINHANVKQLSTLKGIGSAKAQRIVEYIKQNGCFNSIDEIKKVKGIGSSFILKNKANLEIISCKKDSEK